MWPFTCACTCYVPGTLHAGYKSSELKVLYGPIAFKALLKHKLKKNFKSTLFCVCYTPQCTNVLRGTLDIKLISIYSIACLSVRLSVVQQSNDACHANIACT